jgi:uncharacterized protein YabE (DUF348 family)
MNALAWVRNRTLGQVIAGAAILAALGASLVYLGTARRVTLVIGGVERTVYTHAATVAGALRSAGEQPATEDYLQPAAETLLRQVDRIEYRRAQAVLIESPEGTEWVTTAAAAPADILAAAGLRSFPADKVWADGIPVSDPTLPLELTPHRVRLARGRALTLSQPSGTTVLRSSSSTLGEALIEAGFHLRQGDSIVPRAQASLSGLSSAAYLVSRSVEITVDGTELHAMASGPTVGQALAQAGVTLAGLDRSSPDASEPLPASGEVRVTRVREDVLVEQVPVAPKTTPEYSAELELDSREVIDPGAYGMQAKRVRVRFEDGVEVSRASEGEWLAVEPRARIVAYGTKIVLKTLETEFGPVEYYRAVPVYATSYSPCRSGSSTCLYYTSSRKPVQQGVIAVRYAWYLALGFGIPVYIPGYGTATIEDIGGGFPDRYWVDLGYSDEDWVTWGGYTTLYFIAPVPPDVPVIFP